MPKLQKATGLFLVRFRVCNQNTPHEMMVHIRSNHLDAVAVRDIVRTLAAHNSTDETEIEIVRAELFRDVLELIDDEVPNNPEAAASGAKAPAKGRK